MNPRHILVPAFLALCLLLGGASAGGYVANLILQLVSIPIIACSVWKMTYEPPEGATRTVLILTGALVGVCLLQLIPLPPIVWTSLPGRGAIADNFVALGIDLPWLPLSLAPVTARESIMWLLPAIAALLGTTILGAFRARWIAWVILSVTAVSVAIGALQVIGGIDSSVYFYRITNYGNAVGFFANSNHEATLLLIAIPFIAAIRLQRTGRTRSKSGASVAIVLSWAAFIVVGVGLLTNLSLAGLGLAIPVALATFLAFGVRNGRSQRLLVGIAAAVSLAAVTTIFIGPFQNNLVGEQVSNPDLSRQTSFRLTLRAAADYFPIGSGVGSFQGIYRTQESIDRTTRTFMNHAHSDWIEILLETSLFGVCLALAFVIWWIRQTLKIWRTDPVDHFARAATIATATVMVHSIVDYPLRTAAISAIFAACVGLMAGARPFVRRTRPAAGARHMTI